VLFAELLKLTFCCATILFCLEGGPCATLARLKTDIWDRKLDTLKVAVPALCYTVQNNLQFIAASHLEAALLQLLYQTKTLSTAIFGVVILSKSLRCNQWLALLDGEHDPVRLRARRCPAALSCIRCPLRARDALKRRPRLPSPRADSGTLVTQARSLRACSRSGDGAVVAAGLSRARAGAAAATPRTPTRQSSPRRRQRATPQHSPHRRPPRARRAPPMAGPRAT